MRQRFRPGDQVYWWKRLTRCVEYPFRAQVVAVSAKRVTIAATPPKGGPPVLYRVSPDHLQALGMFHQKASRQGPEILEPAASWGKFTSYLEIGEDLRPVREVCVFKNGNMLSYDRKHWCDDFGELGDARINRNRRHYPWGRSYEITPAEFEHLWTAARRSPMWRRQRATALMSRMGEVPVWFTITGWQPSLPKKR